ncbi:MAG TPA: hypothetical protein VN578_21970 [Candidatus Binatia bacterium]|jgi:hypothetical protein|nr:hypothetical protein [Candidatus Binatia bacterium]
MKPSGQPNPERENSPRTFTFHVSRFTHNASRFPFHVSRITPFLLLLTALTVSAADTNAPAASTNAPAAKPAPPLTPEQMFEGGTNSYNNWLDLGVGGFFLSGNKAQFEQRRQRSGNLFGGIEDFHLQGDIAKGTTFLDEHDYKINLGVAKEKLGYVRFSFGESRTWDNGNGGFYPPADLWYSRPGDGLGLDRQDISVEAGLTLEKMPSITFKYTHSSRDGDKDSTSWGLTHPAGGALVRGLSPSFYDINEHSDLFQLDVAHHIKATDFGGGLSYQFGKLNDALKIDQFPGEPVEQKITDRQGTSYDLFNAHAFSETWLKKNLMFSSGLSYSDLDNDFSGSRIYGSDFDVGYVPSAQNGVGYLNLQGGSRLHEYVFNVNLLDKPSEHLTIVPSVRVMKEDWNAESSGTETVGGLNPTTAPFTANSDRDVLDVRERLDLNYNGFTNWVLYARAELTQGDGNLNQFGGLVPVNGIGVPTVQEQTDDRRFFQKYSAGVRWYPDRRITLDAGGYYKLNDYDYANNLDSTLNNGPDRYPGYLVMQSFQTYDGNTRLTLRPLKNVTLVSRYEYQLSTIRTRPDPISGLSEVESSKMTSHILAQDISWSPWSRLYLQAGLNYVVSKTKTPASDVTQAILNAQNNYWTLNFSSGFVLDDKTDLNLNYFYYNADNYQDNSNFGVPYGAGGTEHGIAATVVRRLSSHLRLTLRYGYYHFTDATSGFNNNYEAHVLSTSLRYRF